MLQAIDKADRLRGLRGQLVLFLLRALGQATLQPALRQPVGDIRLRGARQIARQLLGVDVVEQALQALVQHRCRQQTLSIQQQGLQQTDDFRCMVGG